MGVELLNMDCMEYMAGLEDNAFDLAIVDPPYFSGPDKLGFYGARTSPIGVFRKQLKKIGVWHIPDNNYLTELKRVSKHQIIWGINYYKFHHCVGRIIWDKVNGDSSFSDCEIASCSFHDSVRMFRFMWNGMMQGQSISNGHLQQGNKQLNEKRIHPTQKPVALYKWILHNYAKEGDKILDTHLGSGSSAIAAHNIGFDFVGTELDKDYYTAACKRFEQQTAQLKLL